MKTKNNYLLKKIKVISILVCLFISNSVFAEEEITVYNFDGICPEGLVYNPGLGYCDWDTATGPDVLRFKPPVKSPEQSTKFRIAGTDIVFTISSWDFFECSIDGRNERCACGAMGTTFLFVGYVRYSLC